MKITVSVVVLLFTVATFCHGSEEDLESARAVQIVTPRNHTFHLEIDDLRRILEADEIKDRHVIVLSIAGAFRKGKSFLMNFFLKYLYAQYKTHDISDWMGESADGNGSHVDGFKFRGGRKPETMGLWMWSEVFMHDLENGEKVAILLLDTQGIFDSRSSVKDCTATFALSMLMSSVQCYNLMHNIQEDDLQHLRMFTEYGKLALQESTEKPFQYLLFIVRDWQYAYETDYGWQQEVVDDLMAADEVQTLEMQELRHQINSSFDEIGAFLMPYPGDAVALNRHFTGNVREISADFRKYVKDLVTTLLRPENLVVKKINGQKVRARDLVAYLQTYVEKFNGDSLPEPKSLWEATAEANNLILYGESLEVYTDEMQKSMNTSEPFLKDPELQALHEDMKIIALKRFQNKAKLGGDEMLASFTNRLINATDHQFESFKLLNNAKREKFVTTAKMLNKLLCDEIKKTFTKSVIRGIESADSISEDLQSNALKEFDERKMGDSEISGDARARLLVDLSVLEDSIDAALSALAQSLQTYADSMQESVYDADDYLRNEAFYRAHEEAKQAANREFADNLKVPDNEIRFALLIKLDNSINAKQSIYKTQNDARKQFYIVRAHEDNANLANRLYRVHSARARNDIQCLKSYYEDAGVEQLAEDTEREALHEFDRMRTGDDDVSDMDREALRRSFSDLVANLKHVNDEKRSDFLKGEGLKAGGSAVAGAVIGGILFGPAGALVGAIVGGAGSGTYTYTSRDNRNC